MLLFWLSDTGCCFCSKNHASSMMGGLFHQSSTKLNFPSTGTLKRCRLRVSADTEVDSWAVLIQIIYCYNLHIFPSIWLLFHAFHQHPLLNLLLRNMMSQSWQWQEQFPVSGEYFLPAFSFQLLFLLLDLIYVFIFICTSVLWLLRALRLIILDKIKTY